MSVQVVSVRFHRLPMVTRFPFRYGIVSLTQLPHLFVVADVEVDGIRTRGMSADGLPPKWFTKSPKTDFESEDLPEMLSVIRHASDSAVGIRHHDTLFDWWLELYRQQSEWGRQRGLAPLLTGLGTSLMERAVIDAYCRAKAVTLFESLQQNLLGIRFGELRSELDGRSPRDFLPPAPLAHVGVRHTIGMSDPLTQQDLQPDDRLHDGLPQTLEENIAAYGLSYFKIKLSGKEDADRLRLQSICEVLASVGVDQARFTLDGNENFVSMAEFRNHWEELRRDEQLKRFFDSGLIFVEQPVRRELALESDVSSELSAWPQSPPLIIDESDSDFDSLPRALQLGYLGTSHKNCKGIIKGVTQLATIQHEVEQGRNAVLSAEDLGNVGPVALLQDLAVVASLGIPHVERNGHHYFAGLSMFSVLEQERILRNHGDLYRSSSTGYPTRAITRGHISLDSINRAPFGVAELPETDQFEEWRF